MWPVRFTEAARAELIDAQDWYEAEAPGLGRRFRARSAELPNTREFEVFARSAGFLRDNMFEGHGLNGNRPAIGELRGSGEGRNSLGFKYLRCHGKG